MEILFNRHPRFTCNVFITTALGLMTALQPAFGQGSASFDKMVLVTISLQVLLLWGLATLSIICLLAVVGKLIDGSTRDASFWLRIVAIIVSGLATWIMGKWLVPDRYEESFWHTAIAVGLCTGVVMTYLWLAGWRQQREDTARAIYQDRIFSVVIDGLSMKTLETKQLPTEDDIRLELEKQVLDNDHWRREGIREGGRVLVLPLKKLYKKLHITMMKESLPESIRDEFFKHFNSLEQKWHLNFRTIKPRLEPLEIVIYY